MKKIDIVLDSDVIISGLISKKGAGYYLLNLTYNKNCQFVINSSMQQLTELSDVISDLKNIYDLDQIFFKKIKPSLNIRKFSKIESKFAAYTHDAEDIHIVQTAFISKSKFLLTYNLRDFLIQKIANDLSLKVVNPGYFITYLRSL